MNHHGEKPYCCYYHPKEVTVGICALCLNERLLILVASRQGHLRRVPKSDHGSSQVEHNMSHRRSFSLGSFFHLLQFRQQRRTVDDSEAGSLPSLDEDSFISINLGDKSWDEEKKPSMEPEAKGVARWRKRIGCFAQLARRGRPSKASTCHGAGG